MTVDELNLSPAPCHSVNFNVTQISLDHRRGTTGALDLFPRAFGEPVRGYLQRLGHLAVAEHDHVVFRLFDQSALVQQFGSDLGAGIKAVLQRRKADLEPLLLKDVGKTTLGQAAMQWHLSAFE